MLTQQLLVEFENYMTTHHILKPQITLRKKKTSYSFNKSNIIKEKALQDTPHYTNACESSVSMEPSIDDYIHHHKQPKFNEVLFSFIDEKNLDDTKVYKKANIDRRLFSKIRSNPDYKPKKTTALALALALELKEDEVNILLSSAGYALNQSDTFDLVIRFCLEKNIYRIYDINELLHHYNAALL